MTKYETEEENRDKRAAVLVIPAYLIGKAVVQTVFWGLVAMYGLYKVRQAGITIKANDSHTCYQNRGWCRPRCFRHEREISWENGVCGFNRCCYSR